MLIASWNVNSIRARLELLTQWLSTYHPDIVCLQETKTEDANFPYKAIKSMGYHSYHWGQKTYNGVAILSKQPPESVTHGFEDHWPEEPQSRLIRAHFILKTDSNRAISFTIANVYAPNGQAIDSDKFNYKLAFYRRLTEALTHDAAQTAFLMCGDFNIAPSDLDVYNPAAFHEQLLCSSEERNALKTLLETHSLTDVCRMLSPQERIYTWWDYRMNAFKRNLGLRIDHIFANQQAKAWCQNFQVHTAIRAMEKSSDHAPIAIHMSL